MLARMWQKGNPHVLLVEMHTGAVTVESIVKLPQKIKNGAAFWLSDSTSRNNHKETQNTNSKEYKHRYVHCSIIYNSQDLRATQAPSADEWIKKLKYWISNQVRGLQVHPEDLGFLKKWWRRKFVKPKKAQSRFKFLWGQSFQEWMLCCGVRKYNLWKKSDIFLIYPAVFIHHSKNSRLSFYTKVNMAVCFIGVHHLLFNWWQFRNNTFIKTLGWMKMVLFLFLPT